MDYGQDVPSGSFISVNDHYQVARFHWICTVKTFASISPRSSRLTPWKFVQLSEEISIGDSGVQLKSSKQDDLTLDAVQSSPDRHMKINVPAL